MILWWRPSFSENISEYEVLYLVGRDPGKVDVNSGFLSVYVLNQSSCGSLEDTDIAMPVQ